MFTLILSPGFGVESKIISG